mgnify:CR=1 FL=1
MNDIMLKEIAKRSSSDKLYVKLSATVGRDLAGLRMLATHPTTPARRSSRRLTVETSLFLEFPRK